MFSVIKRDEFSFILLNPNTIFKLCFSLLQLKRLPCDSFYPLLGKSHNFLLRCSHTQAAFIQIVKLLLKHVCIKKKQQKKHNLTDAFYATVSLWSLADQTALIAPLNQSNGSTI